MSGEILKYAVLPASVDLPGEGSGDIVPPIPVSVQRGSSHSFDTLHLLRVGLPTSTSADRPGRSCPTS